MNWGTILTDSQRTFNKIRVQQERNSGEEGNLFPWLAICPHCGVRLYSADDDCECEHQRGRRSMFSEPMKTRWL